CPFQDERRIRRLRLVMRQFSQGLIERGPERRRLDGEQQIPLFNVLTLLKMNAEELACYLGLDRDGSIGQHRTNSLDGQRDALRCHASHGNRHGGCGRGVGMLRSATTQAQDGCEGGNQSPSPRKESVHGGLYRTICLTCQLYRSIRRGRQNSSFSPCLRITQIAGAFYLDRVRARFRIREGKYRSWADRQG